MANHGVHGSADDRRLEERFARLEHEATFGRYGRLYGGFAVVILALSFMPFYALQDGAPVTYYNDSLWTLSTRRGGETAALGIIFMLVLILLLTLAAFRPTWAWPLIGIVLDGALIALMLVARPGAGDPKPELAPAALAGLVLVLVAMALCVVHAVHLYRHVSRSPHRGMLAGHALTGSWLPDGRVPPAR